ncbi:MAG: hypothetical protein JNM61_10370 [Zoogloeaceae bacterium]|nr:hypothetical protein [Zoogloeaceae bacterium]
MGASRAAHLADDVCGPEAGRDVETQSQTFFHRKESCMNFKQMVVGVSVALVFAGGAQAQTFKETATCKLTNTEVDKTLYEGTCKVKQSMSGDNTIFSVKMGHAEPFLFAGKRGSADWMHGPEHVRFTDLPTGGIFKWSHFALVVAEDGESTAPPQNVGREYDRGCEDAKMGSYDRSRHSSAYEDGWQACKKR